MHVFIWCIIQSLLTHIFLSTLKFLCILNKFWLALILQNKTEFRDCLKCSAKCTGKAGMMFLKDLRRELEEVAKTSLRTDFALGVPTDMSYQWEDIFNNACFLGSVFWGLFLLVIYPALLSTDKLFPSVLLLLDFCKARKSDIWQTLLIHSEVWQHLMFEGTFG